MPSSACNLITFFFIYSVSPNSISNLLLRLHSQNSSFLQNQNQNPLSSFFCVCFPSTPQYHQRKSRFDLCPLLVVALAVAQAFPISCLGETTITDASR
ncbi:hypothetical protein YC2023_015397 [Brassica napus]